MTEMKLKKKFTFDAAHYLPNLPDTHKCRRLHGHSFNVFVTIKGEKNNDTGWVMDFGEITEKARQVIDSLDHRFLNEINGLENPTSENIALWLWERLKKAIHVLHEIEIHESDSSVCIYRGE